MPMNSRITSVLFFLVGAVGPATPQVFGDPSRDIVLTLPVVEDPRNCFPHDGSPITIGGDRVTSIQLPKDRKLAFTDGLVAIRVSDKWGYMDTKRSIVIAPRFDSVEPFSEERAVVTIGKLHGYIDRSGKYIVEPRFAWGYSFRRGVASVRSGDRYGLIDLNGGWVLQPRFKRIDPSSAGL